MPTRLVEPRTLIGSVGAVLFSLGIFWSISTGADLSVILLWVGLTAYALANAIRRRLPAGGRIVYVGVGGIGLLALALGVEKPGAKMIAIIFSLIGAGTVVDLVLLRLDISWNQMG